MPIRRQNDNDPDWMAKKQDKELLYLEERIAALYEEANSQLSREYLIFYSNYQQEYERRLAMVNNGEMAQEEFEAWCRNKILRSNRYQATLAMLTDVLTNADVAAMALVNEQLPYTLAESYDFISSLGFEAADRAGISMGTFQIYNADSVQAIIRDNPDLLPVVDLPEDQRWNRSHINNEITQAIIRGDSIPQVAQRLQRVAQMDNNAAIRNARTSMTAAENLGRSESASRLRDRGLPVEEVWSAAHDSRTRDTHLLLDGTKKDKNGYFGVGIIAVPLRFPADPLGEPQEIYNCRCRNNVRIASIDHSRDDELYENFMQENYPEDWNELQRRRADINTGEGRRWQERQEALERQARLREERASQAQANAQPEFTPARSIAEAEEYATRFADNVDYSGLSLDKANQINETLTNLTYNYPINRLDEIGQVSRGRGAMAMANYQYLRFNRWALGKKLSDDSIRFAENQERRRATIEGIISRYPNGRIPVVMRNRIESLQADLQYTRWMVADSYDDKIRSLVSHEYGHIIADQYFAQINRGRSFGINPAPIRDNWAEIYQMAIGNGDVYAISQYGGTDAHEFFAECFAAREMGETLPEYIENFMRRLFENGVLPIL